MGDTERQIAVRLKCSPKQVWRSKQRETAPAFLARYRAKQSALRDEGPDALEAQALEARVAGRTEEADQLGERARIAREEQERRVADALAALPMDDPSRGLAGGFLEGARGWITYRAALLAVRDPMLREQPQERREAEALFAALRESPKRRSWYVAAWTDLLQRDAELKVRDGLGKYLLGRHAELWPPSRAAVADVLTRFGVAVSPEADAAVLAEWMELALRELCPLEEPEMVSELVPFALVPANLEPVVLGVGEAPRVRGASPVIPYPSLPFSARTTVTVE